ncbi:MAG: pilus assembly protein TadG-related protein, partial [Anaerolineales bacterium]|nr:pilus assembly protein TadG-related protein [Anaerolineales bacterium]
MNNRDSQRSESGQSLVLIALSAILLLGMSGLAIDGGILFSDRRHAQNAADSAAMAGAFAILQGNDPVAAAYARAADNDFDDNGTTNWVTVEYPPSSGPYA